MNITSAQDPPYFPGPFSIDGQGQLWAPSQGLKGQAQKVSMTWRYPWTGHKMDRAITSWRIVSGLINHAAFPRHSPYLLPHAGCPLTLAWFCAGLWSSRKKRDPWLQEPTVPLTERRKF